MFPGCISMDHIDETHNYELHVYVGPIWKYALKCVPLDLGISSGRRVT